MDDPAEQIKDYDVKARAAQSALESAQASSSTHQATIDLNRQALKQAQSNNDATAIELARDRITNASNNKSIADTEIAIARQQQAYYTNQITKLSTAAIDATTQTPVQVVSSGTGRPTKPVLEIPASAFSNSQLSSGNQSLLSTDTRLTYTRNTKISRDQLETADRQYTTSMNQLSGFWSSDDITSPGYQDAKQAALNSQRTWELARDNLEQVVVEERSSHFEQEDPFGDAELDIPQTLALDVAVTDPEEDQSGDVVVTGVPVDQRIRLRPKLMEGNKYPFFGDENSVLHMLNETNGVFFPYTPTITTGNSASYSTMTPTHANTDYYSYTNSPAVKIQINGQFSAQNLSEARYTLAAMHFFRSATKMRFGEKDDNRGQPPPILVLTGYGDFMFNTLDVILTDFTMELPNDVDYLEVRIGDILSWVPSLVTFGVTCVVQQSPRQQKQEFSLDEFISGELFKGGLRGWI